MRFPWSRHLLDASAEPGLTPRQITVLSLCGLSVIMATFDGSLLFLALPRIATDFSARLGDLSNLGSVVAVGALGALPLGILADRKGRRRLIAIGVAAFSLADLAGSLAPTLAALAATRVIAGCFEGLVGGVAAAMVIEEMPARHRSLAIAVVTASSGIGGAATLIGYPLMNQSWRPLYALGGIGFLVSGAVWVWLPESQVWEAAGPSASALGRLFKPPWRGRLVIFSVVAALGSLAYEPGGLFVALFGSQHLRLTAVAISTLIFVSGALSVPGYLCGGWLADRFGRRLPGTALFLAGGTAAGFTYLFGVRGYQIGNLVWGFLTGAMTPVLTAWFAELFPTRSRVTAEVSYSIVAAAGGILGLQLLSVFGFGLGLGHALALLAVGPLIGGGLLLFLPETRAQPLPD